jgi:hypothetical protein
MKGEGVMKCALGILLTAASLVLPGAISAQGVLENPQPDSHHGGIGVISGWVCDANEISVEIDGHPAFPAPYGTQRLDTQSVCGDSNNGFGVLMNWNLLGDAEHTLQVFADGALFGSATFRVSTLGTEFLAGASGVVTVEDFPEPGQSVTLQWQESMQNFVITEVTGAIEPIAAIDGVWDFTGALAQQSCSEPSSLTTISDSFQIDRHGKALYATAAGGTLEFVGEAKSNDFTLSTPPRSAALNDSCTQVVSLTVEGNFKDQRASYTIVNDFVGTCPGASDCEFIYEGPFIQTRSKKDKPLKKINSPSLLFSGPITDLRSH